jgi:azurin
LDDTLKNVTWRRYATGLSQPFGLKVIDDVVYTTGRDQITALHDLNDDGEADYYECVANDYQGKEASHTHTFGFDTDGAGNAYFINDVEMRMMDAGSDSTRVIATGFRNCMGLGVSDDGVVLVGPQEGTWTPASMMIEIHEGEFYGFGRDEHTGHHISPPMCFVPRGIDNSTGGMVWVDSDRFGPLKDRFVGLSYGYGSWYLVLRQAKGPRSQGAVVPLEGEFRSGVVRGDFHPKDGQLYVVGCEGWGNYAVDDGCFNRVRYTGKPLRKPTGFEVFYNGIRMDFPEPLDAAAASDNDNYFIQQWDYEYAKRYGSPEFSPTDDEMLGHDRVRLSKAHVMNGGRSVFLEIPEMRPVMQMHIRMHLSGADGVAFKTSLFPTVLHLGEAFKFEGMAPLVDAKQDQLVMRVRQQDLMATDQPKVIDAGAKKPVDRHLTVNAVGGLRYDVEELRAKAGEYVALTLVNADVMPHNLVVVSPGAYEKVGMASFKMLNDPKAGDKHYVPDMAEVLANTFVIFPGVKQTIYIDVPDEPDAYPFLCTFPGHWQTMKGVLIVE